MATIVTRSGKGSPLTNNEVDANFTNLNTELGTKANTSSLATVATTGAYADLTGKPTLVDASNVAITGGSITGTTIDSITNHVGADHIHYKIKATQILAKGDVVKVVGFNAGENAFEVAKVSASTDIAVGVVYSALASGALGSIINTGLLEGIDTSAYAIGTTLYPNTSGGFTSTKPTSGRYQALAFVVRSNANNGTILIEASEPQSTSLSQFTNDSGYITGINSGNVTTALGYTPANRAGDTFTGPITVNSGANQAILGSDGAIELTRGAGGAYIDFKDSTAEDFDVRLQASGSQLNISAAGGLTLNGAGVLTGITSGQVTTALGYTPYNATNPAGYITSAGSISGNAATATNISNTGTVTLASATESNSIYATAPSYTADQPTKLLNFDWYSNVFSIGNIRGGSTNSNGFGVYYTASGGSRSEIARFLTNGNLGLGNVSPQSRFTIGSAQGNSLEFTYSSDNAYRNIIANYWNSGADTRMDFNIGRTGNVAPVTVMSVGYNSNVGVGTTEPAGRIHSVSTSAFTAPNLLCTDTVSNFRIVFNTGAYAGVPANKPWLHSYDDIYIGSDANVTTRFMSGGATNLAVASTGIVTAATAFNAPVFTDSLNSAYYVDPNGNSNISQLMTTGAVVIGGVFANNSYGTAGARLLFGGGNEPDTYFIGTNIENYGGNYSKLDLRWHTGIRIGAQPSYGGVRFYDTEALGTQIFAIGKDGSYAQANQSMRAPVFYDLDNTTYYIDPASGSNLIGQVQINGGTTMSGGWNRALYLASQFPVIVMNSGSVKYSGIGVDYSEAQSGMVFWVNGNSADITNGSATAALRINTGNYVVANDFRAAIFYDTNNSGYFLDPAGSSNLVSVQINGTLDVRDSNAQFWRSTNGAYQRVDTRTEATSLSRAHWYGVSSAGGTSNFRHAWYDNAAYFNVTAQDGEIIFERTAGDTIVRSTGSFRAPIFYDSDNTGYYLDPNVGSSLNVATVNEIYTHGWFRNHNSSQGIYNQATGQHWYSDSGNYWNMGGGNLNGQGIRFRDNNGGTVRGYVYYDQSNNVGFLNNEGNWRARVVGGDYFLADGSSARAQLFYDSNDTAYYINGAGDSVLNTLYFRNGSIQAKFAQVSQFGYSSSYRTIVLGNEYLTTISMGVDVSGNASGSFNGQGEGREVLFRNGVSFITPNAANNSYLNVMQLSEGNAYFTNIGQASGSLRAPLFYDSNDTSYFVDPNSTSRLSVANVNFLTLFNDEGLNVKGIRGQFAAGSDGQGISLFSNVDIGYPSGWGSGLGNAPSRGLSIYGGLRVAYSGGGFITSDTSVRSPIFYDSNDTAYYVDPTVSSNLNDLIVTRNIASPSNYYADLQLEVQATSGTAGIGLHRAGYSHCGIYHDSINQLKFNFNNGTVTLNHNAGSLIGTGNDETYIRLRDAVTSEDWNSYIDGAEASYRIVTNATGANRAGAYNYGVLLSMANAGQAKFQLYAPHNGTDGNGLWVRTGWDGDYDSWNEIAIQSRSFTNNVDLRAPIFYDSQNTAYFADPNGRSRLASMDYGDGGYYFAGGDWGYRHNTPYGWIQFGPANSGHAHIYTDRSNFYFNAQIQVLGGSQINQNDIRSPIFYDTDNTGYYINPANEYSANFAGYTYFGNHGGGNVGNYSSYRYQLVWAIGDSYKGTLDGTSVAGGYGLWFSHPNAGGVASNLSTHGLMLIQNGAFMASLDPSMRAVNDMRAPIYYDLNNTGYYWNFGDAAVSNINTVITGVAYYRSNLGSSAYSGAQSSPPLQVYSSDAGTAMFSFHRAGYYAVNMGLDPDNVLRIGGWSASANRFQMDMSGNLTMAGNVTAYSDARLKEDVATITNALDLVSKMRGVTYTRKDTGEAGVGVIAQEMLEVLPEVVQQGIGEDDTLSVAYGNLVGVLIEAIKELRDEVEMLRK